jgi:hypothetical protein
MFSRLPVWLTAAILLAGASLRGEERNGWPVSVEQTGTDGRAVSGEYLGPLFFQRTDADGTYTQGMRPLLLQTTAGQRRTTQLLYPLFTWQKEGAYRSFSFFQLVNARRQAEPGQEATRNLDVWPFYFSRDTGVPDTSYRALFPIGGTIKQRLGYDRIHFVLFPGYLQTQDKGEQVTHAPWPFLRFIAGDGHHGFEFWPLFGHRGRAGDYDSQFYLWPLIYKTSRHLSDPSPDVKQGFLPFYTRDTAPGSISENYVWPLFGYTHRTEPDRYDEWRYLWPFLVQGRGDVRYVNRWAPFYTHSVTKGYDKTWLLWPLLRHAEWTESGLNQEQNQVLWFVYWSLTQRSATNPAAAPGHKTHLWPLFSAWDNGAGCRQFQLLSPFEVFFPTNEPVRQLYSPLLAVYRYDRRAPDDVRGSLLFSLLSWKHSPAEKEFHLGPLFGTRTTAAQSRVTVGSGLLAWTRLPGTGRWKFSLFDFSPKAANKAGEAPSP